MQYTEHAGYRRAIISRNPTLFDEDGDEVEDPYSLGGTLTPLEENPYEHVKIERKFHRGTV